MTSNGGIDDEEEESSEQSSKRDYDRDDKSLMVFLFLECHMSSLAGIERCVNDNLHEGIPTAQVDSRIACFFCVARE